MSNNTQCAVLGCKTNQNRRAGILFYSYPTSTEQRNKWLQILKNKCRSLDWSKNKICSRHFEHKYIDAQRKLKENAVPTLFVVPPTINTNSTMNSKIDRILNQMTQAELMVDININMSTVKEPDDLYNYVDEDMICKLDAPLEVKLWLLLKKQHHLNTRLTEMAEKTNKHVEVLQNNLEETRNAKKEMERNIESFKYIVKSLQEKHATLEEQIEILTAVESR